MIEMITKQEYIQGFQVFNEGLQGTQNKYNKGYFFKRFKYDNLKVKDENIYLIIDDNFYITDKDNIINIYLISVDMSVNEVLDFMKKLRVSEILDIFKWDDYEKRRHFNENEIFEFLYDFLE